MEFPGIKKLTVINDPKEGIAKSKRSTGEVVINQYYWRRLKPEHKIFVLCHEEGHIVHNTRDELLADEYASKKYLDAGYSIYESEKALEESLDRTNPVHIGRIWAQYNRALKYDWLKNKNKKAYRDHYDSADTVRTKLQTLLDGK